MNARPQPPAMLVHLGDEVRRARKAAGLTQEDLGVKLFVVPTLISMIETAARLPRNRDLIERLDAELFGDGRFVRLWEVVSSQDVPDWEIGRTEAERRAVGLRTFELALVPGLLQTPEYARAVFIGGMPGEIDEDELRGRIERRLARRDLLDRLETCHFVLDESALHRFVGSREVMRGQFAHMLELVKRRVVTLQVLRNDTAAVSAMSAPMVIYDLDDGDQVVYLERAVDGQTTTDGRIIAACVKQFDMLRTQAAGLNESAQLIRDRMEALA